jgi:transcriptional repressor NrdR
MGVEAALADRPVPASVVEELLAAIEVEVLALRSPVESDDVGRMVLDGLREVDEVAYVRFASVYREFQGAEDFEQALADLGEQVTAQE